MNDALTKMQTNIDDLRGMEKKHKEDIAKEEIELAATNDELEQGRINQKIDLLREELDLIEAHIPILINERHTLVRAKTMKPISTVFKTSYNAKRKFYN
ncbi:unnamed protein product [Microthlaspi erraticum]|uniref:Uncharacterized protein n=1 Tax=Microthlaspi erraticum TaxID=1685480 RepID=A0A6D2HU00_9BRAS|nr:unnamed protein product [Microthlaspi erraticum]